jgi:nucleoside-diphosphate-sugar epimerase
LKISILGCGWLGMPLGEKLVSKGHQIKGSYRKIENVSILQSFDIEPINCSLDPHFEGDAAIFDADVLVISIPPRLKTKGEAFHLEQIKAITEQIKRSILIKNIVFVSSTSVYGKEPGLYSESMADTTHVLYKAEEMVISFCKENMIQFQILRMGGLMGYDREPCKYLNVESSDLASRVNYVFRDDAISAIEKVAFESEKSGIFNISSPIHPTRGEILKNRCGIKSSISGGMKESKIIDSQLFIDQYGFEYAFSDPIHFPK